MSDSTSRFEALLRKYAPMVRGLCASHVYDPSALDDLVQESFVAGYVNLHTLRDRRKFGPWIAQITRNKCQSWLRERVREERGQDRLQAEALPNTTPDPLSQLARRELCEWVRNQIGSLPDKTREAMLLCYVEGLKIREAAQFLDASESSIKKRLQYGRDQLGEKIWNELGELKRPATDEQPICKKVMAALPLASMPWKAGGSAAASTLLGGSAIGGNVLAVTGIAAVLMCAITVWVTIGPDSRRSNEAVASANPNEPKDEPDLANTAATSIGETGIPARGPIQTLDSRESVPAGRGERLAANVADAAGTVSGHVYTHDGLPVPYAHISRARPDGSFGQGVATTDAVGLYNVKHDGGTLILRAQGRLSTTSETVTLELAMDESVQQDFVLSPSASARFEFRAPDGSVPEEIDFSAVMYRPVDSDLVYCTSGQGSVFEREGDLFLLPAIEPGQYCVLLSVKGYEMKRFEFSMPPDYSDRRFFLPLGTGGYWLTVLIYDERGEPLPDSGILLSYVGPMFSSDDGVQPNPVTISLEGTNEQGLAVFEGLLAGAYHVTALDDNKEIMVPHTGTITFGKVAHSDTNRSRLRVAEKDIRLIDGTHANTSLSMDSASLFLVSPSGIVSTEWVEVGENLLIVVKSGYTAAIQPLTVSAEYIARRQANGSDEYGQPIQVTIAEGGGIFGMIECPQDQDPSGKRIHILPAACWQTNNEAPRTSGLERFLTQGAQSDTDGAFHLSLLPPGEYLIYSESEWRHAVPVTVVQGQETGPIEITVK